MRLRSYLVISYLTVILVMSVGMWAIFDRFMGRLTSRTLTLADTAANNVTAANGTVLIPFPLDYGVWSVRADRVVKNTLAGHKTGSRGPAKFELWVTGTVSPLARQQLQAQGITGVERVDRRVGMMD